MKIQHLIPFFVLGLILSSGCSSKENKDSDPLGSYARARIARYTEETPKAIIEGSLYLSSAIVLAAFIKGVFSK